MRNLFHDDGGTYVRIGAVLNIDNWRLGEPKSSVELFAAVYGYLWDEEDRSGTTPLTKEEWSGKDEAATRTQLSLEMMQAWQYWTDRYRFQGD